MFLGNILVTYFNPKGKDTYGKDGVKPSKYVVVLKDWTPIEFKGSVPEPYALMIREQKVLEIRVTLE